jgi:hypothetical protein
MANNASGNNTMLWLLALAVCFLLGKTCNCGKEKIEPVQYYPATVITDTNAALKEKYMVVKPVYKSPARRYIRGPRGGCYYINDNGSKVYVDRSICD